MKHLFFIGLILALVFSACDTVDTKIPQNEVSKNGLSQEQSTCHVNSFKDMLKQYFPERFIFAGISGCLAILAFYIFMLTCLAEYAKRLGHPASTFVVLGIFFTPFLAAFCLCMLGKTEKHRNQILHTNK